MWAWQATALAGAKLFVDEEAHVFISGSGRDALDQAVELIGRNVTGVQADWAQSGTRQQVGDVELKVKLSMPTIGKTTSIHEGAHT